MSDNEIYEKLQLIINDIKGDDIQYDRNTPLIETGIMDSLELINYLTQIEEVFGINVTMDVLIDKKLGIIQNLIDYISQRS